MTATSEIRNKTAFSTSSTGLLAALGCALLLLVVQLATGTDPLFAVLVFTGLLVSWGAVMALGGWRNLPGFCVAILALKFLLISQLAKLLFGEPGDSNLDVPIVTLGVLVTGFSAMFVAALVSRVVPVGRPLMVAEWNPEPLRVAALVSLSLGLTSYLTLELAGGIRVGGVFGILKQFLFFQALSIALGTAWTITSSGGRRLFSWVNGLPFGVQFVMGFIEAGRLKMLEPVLLVLLTAVAYRFRFRPAHFGFAAAAALVGYLFLIPFGALARSEIRDADFGRSLSLTGEFIRENFSSFGAWQDFYLRYDENLEDTGFSYFDEPNGTLDRLSMIKPVDILAAATLSEGESGWETVSHGFKMLPPRLLYPQKPAFGTGTMLGHKAGMLSSDDEGTQVSFGFIADSFSAFGWWGAAVIPFLIALGFNLVYGKLVGGMDGNVWCVVMMAHFQHYFAESGVAALTLVIFQQSLVFLASWFFLKLLLHFEPWRLFSELSGKPPVPARHVGP